MKSFKKLLLLMFAFIPLLLSAQNNYSVGTSTFSINPDDSNISLHLGGYGGPREGRFTIQWKSIDYLTAVTAMTGSEDRLFIVSNGHLLFKSLIGKGSWTTAGIAENIKAIAAANGYLYALKDNGEILQSSDNKLKWKSIATTDKSSGSLTVYKGRFYVANSKGDIWTKPLRGSVWTRILPLQDITGLTANDRYLYAIKSDGEMHRCAPEKENANWLKAAYKNNLTVKEDIRLAAIAGDLLYGLDNNNILYKAEHRTEGNLTARTMAIRSGVNTILIVSLDVCGVNDTYTGQVKEAIFKKYNIPTPAVFINSSHTHFAPVSQNWFTWQPPNQQPDNVFLYSDVWNGIMNSVEGALKALKPAKLYFGRGKTDIGYNRSLRDHQELYDSSVDVLKVKYDDNTESYLFLAACHAVFSSAGTLHYTISANFPGVACKLVEERTDTKNAMFLQGTAGDINPRDNGEYISGEKLANEVISVLNRPMKEITGPISSYLDTINIPVQAWPREEIVKLKQENIDKIGDITAERDVKWCSLMLKYLDEGTMPKVMPVYYNTLNIGNWKLVGFSRETTTEYGFGVKKLWPDKLISVAGYTNDVSSYLPTTLHIRAKNYEGLGSFFWYGMPNTFPEGVENMIIGTIEKLAR